LLFHILQIKTPPESSSGGGPTIPVSTFRGIEITLNPLTVSFWYKQQILFINLFQKSQHISGRTCRNLVAIFT